MRLLQVAGARVRPFVVLHCPLAGHLAAASALCVGLGVVRVLFCGRSTLFWLTGNLFLAWIPLVFAFAVRHSLDRPASESSGKRFRASGLFMVGWLLFFPNAPYLVTDFVHLYQRPGVPIWYDIMLFMSFAWTGLLLGFLSLRVLHEVVSQRWGEGTGHWFVVVSLALCSFGVYMGRIGRWNSWDVVCHPFALTQWCLWQFAPESIIRTAGFCGPTFLLQLVVYTTLLTLFEARSTSV